MIHSKKQGEKAWPPLMMFKAMLLQSWYKLSDPVLDKQLARGLLFRHFTGLDISEPVPDHATFWRFRQTLEKLCLMDGLLNKINQQLSDQGLYIKSGEVSIVDKVNGVARDSALGYASIIEAKNCRPNKNKSGNSTQDTEARWNVKVGSDGKRKSTYGYKAHVNVDASAAYADSAYQSQHHSLWLEARSIKNRIIKRAYRNKPLNKKLNSLIKPTPEYAVPLS